MYTPHKACSTPEQSATPRHGRRQHTSTPQRGTECKRSSKGPADGHMHSLGLKWPGVPAAAALKQRPRHCPAPMACNGCGCCSASSSLHFCVLLCLCLLSCLLDILHKATAQGRDHAGHELCKGGCASAVADQGAALQGTRETWCAL